MGIEIHRVCVASGSAGTHAGLLTGFLGCNMNIPIVGIGVSRDPQDQDPLVHKVAVETAKRLGIRQEIEKDSTTFFF